ncbi:MAG: Uma2 family endonuclease [Caldilineales bacterium]
MIQQIEAAVLEAEPTWDVAKLFPDQGMWSEEEYLMLPDNRLTEFSHGRLEVLPMPSFAHQLLVMLFYRLLHARIVSQNLGYAVVAPMRIQLWRGKYREPDVALMLRAHRERIHEQYWEGADLVMEVVSPDDPLRDVETKRREYAQAGIPEYWLVNPASETITVFTLPADAASYDVHGVYTRGETAASLLLAGFTVDVEACFAEAENF